MFMFTHCGMWLISFFVFSAKMTETYLVLHRQVRSGLCHEIFQINRFILSNEVCVITNKPEEQFPGLQ